MSAPYRGAVARSIEFALDRSRSPDKRDIHTLAICEAIDQAGLNIMAELSGIRDSIDALALTLNPRRR